MNTILFKGLNTFKKPFITIYFDKDNNWLVADWSGRQTEETIKEGGKQILRYLKETHSTKVLNDNTKVVGTWTEASEWATSVWLPQMLEAGLKHFAWVHSEDAFSRFAANKVAAKSDKSIVRMSKSIKESTDWLRFVDETYIAA